ncbi:MAG TPA: trypsin-like peptidase domain-containing protein [Gemmataceae bacterium]|jgi:serine protease Do|nr:trypsin-like peptidase domain-containing protein [Gemmataceae bacterium]
MSASRFALPLLLFGSLSLSHPAIAAEPVNAGVAAELSLTKVPANVSELRALQNRIQDTVKKVMPATVGVVKGNSAGSGVIVSEDGYVLTAAHVIGSKADQEVTLIMPDGKHVKAKTLGANSGIDSGMIKITDEGKWPFAAMGESASLKKGEWCFSLGHPGGYHPNRKPVLRVGRILDSSDTVVRTDCTLVGGDSGGPLFDLDGKVIGIHSRIGLPIVFNFHVPVDTFRETWDRLAKGETWASTKVRPMVQYQAPKAAVQGAVEAANRIPAAGIEGTKLILVAGMMRIQEVEPGSLSDKAGLKPKDYLLKIEGKEVATYDDIAGMLKKKWPGQTITVVVERNGEDVTLKLVLGKSKT